MGNLLATGATKRKYHHVQDLDSDDDCCSHHATTSSRPRCRKKRKTCCSCECSHTTKDDNKTQREGMNKKSNLNNVGDCSCSNSNNNTASNNQICASSIEEATVKLPSTENTANKIRTEGEPLSTTATTKTVEPRPISVTESKIDKTPTAPKATTDRIRPLGSTEANTKTVETPTASKATTYQLKPSISTDTKIDKTPITPKATTDSAGANTKIDKTSTAPTATTDKSRPSSSTEAKDKSPEGILDTEVSFDQKIQLSELEDSYVNFLREEFIFPNVNREAFLSASLAVERGLIIHGISHRIVDRVSAFANELSRIYGKQTRMFTRSPQQLFHPYSEDAEKYMKRITDSVEKCAKDTPIIIFVQDLRSFFQYCNTLKRADASSFMALTNLFRAYLGNSSKYLRLFVIGTVDDIGIVPKSLIGNGMFAKSLSLFHSSYAGPVGRMIHLKDAVRKWSVQPSDKLLEEMAEKTDEFTPLQLQELAQSVYKYALNSTIKKLLEKSCCKCAGDPISMKIEEGVLTSINPTLEDWNVMLKPKLKKVDDTPNAGATITFSSVGGLDEQIKYLRENIIFPLKQRDVLKEWGVEPVRGIIFYGPPGTGKTLLAKAMANELNKVLEEEAETTPKEIAPSPSQPTTKKKYSFFYRKATDCFNKYVGESERILRDLFTQAQKEAPSLIFFDEFDGLCPTRTNSNIQFYTGIVTTLLGLMDSVKRGDILIIAATNRLDSLDPAIRRPGRFDKAVGFPMPEKEGRENILRIHTESWRNGNGKEILEQMAEKTVGYTGADLEHLARETLLIGMQRLLEEKTTELNVTPEDWHKALSSFKPSNNSGKIEFGSGTTFLERVPAGVKLLLQTNVAKIEEKLQPIFTQIKENKSGNGNGGLNSFIITSRSENDDSVNRYLVPLLLTDSKLSKDVAAYTLDLSDVQKLTKDSIRTTLSQLRSPPDGKVALLLVPQIEMFIKMKNSSANGGGIVDYVLTELQTLRGKNIILLATSKLTLNKVNEMEDILTLFKDVGGSKCHEFIPPSQPELESFFKTISQLEKKFSKQLEYVVKFGEGKDVATLLDLHAELQRMMQDMKGEENKTDETVLQQLKTLFKAFDNHKTMCRNHLQLYM